MKDTKFLTALFEFINGKDLKLLGYKLNLTIDEAKYLMKMTVTEWNKL